jgi:hypothetical protein
MPDGPYLLSQEAHCIKNKFNGVSSESLRSDLHTVQKVDDYVVVLSGVYCV